MRKNLFLRTALWLLIGTWASCGMVWSTTLAKYAAAGPGNASARFAAFTFEVRSNKPALTWDEVVDGLGTAAFDLPLFDYEYTNSTSNVPGPDVTVKGVNNEIVIAPGTGGVGVGNPNRNTNWIRGNDHQYYSLYVRNKSEVSVRYKIYVDPRPVNAIGINMWFETWAPPPPLGVTPGLGKWRLNSYSAPILIWDSGDPTMNSSFSNLDLAPNTDSGVIYIAWWWPFDQTKDPTNEADSVDTALGAAGTGTVSLPLIFEVIQID